MKYILVFSTLTFLLFSCKTYTDEEIEAFDQKIQQHIKKNKLDMQKSSSGLYYHIIDQGQGREIGYRDMVSFKYKGSLLNGDVFDQATEPVEFETSSLIQCWKEVILMLKPGGKAHLISPPTLGYGDRDLDKIPANSILEFDIEVVEVK